MQKIYFFETPGDFNVELILVKKNNAWVAMIDTFRFIQNGITLCAKAFNINIKAENLVQSESAKQTPAKIASFIHIFSLGALVSCLPALRVK